MNVWEELSKLIEQLRTCVKSLKTNGITLANKEREYKELLRLEVIKLKDEGTTGTLIEKIVYGIPEVAAKREARDIAEATYKANLEAVGSIKLQMKVLESKINYDIEKDKEKEN